MKMVQVIFDFKEEGKCAPVGYQEINCHMILDVKMDFTRKTRFVSGGKYPETPASATYASVVYRESVRVRLLSAALNDGNVLSADKQGTYLNVPCK